MFRFSQSLDFDYPAALVWAYLATARVSCRFSTVAPGSKWWLKQALSLRQSLTPFATSLTSS